MLSDVDVEDFHSTPSARLVELEKQNCGSCGFHLTRSKWDPYPWVSKVDLHSPADVAGMRPGDCILEINGEDIVGKRISEVAERVRSGSNQVSLLLWNSGTDPQCTPESLCCGPMPQNLQRLSACMSSILAVLECPVCLDTIPPPAHQCDNGHLMCLRCRAKSERCPVCRIRLSRGRSLLAEQVYNSITDVFDLREESEQMRKAKMQTIFKLQGKNKNVPDIKVTQSHTNKFLARLIGKSTSVDNLSSGSVKSQVPMVRFSLEHDFGTNLKTKSLSTSEISKSVSPLPSRAGSFYQLHGGCKSSRGKFVNLKREGKSSPASYHGSFESLERKLKDDSKLMNNHLLSVASLVAECDIVYHCPYDFDCSSAIQGSEIIRHFQLMHHGPLIQYFQPKLKLPFANIRLEKDPCYVMHIEEMIFFLRILDIMDNVKCKAEKNSTNPDILLWIWVLADWETCSKFQFQVKILNSEDTVMLSVTSAVHSLEKVSWRTIVETRRGVFLNSDTVEALNSGKLDSFLEIEILKVSKDVGKGVKQKDPASKFDIAADNVSVFGKYSEMALKQNEELDSG